MEESKEKKTTKKKKAAKKKPTPAPELQETPVQEAVEVQEVKKAVDLNSVVPSNFRELFHFGKVPSAKIYDILRLQKFYTDLAENLFYMDMACPEIKKEILNLRKSYKDMIEIICK